MGVHPVALAHLLNKPKDSIVTCYIKTLYLLMASGSVEYFGDYVEKKILSIKRCTSRIKTFAMMIFIKLFTFKSLLN